MTAVPLYKVAKRNEEIRERMAFKKLLACPVCQEVYKQPKSMSCGHSICASCEVSLTAKDQLTSCPVCQTPITGPTTGGLPINHTLADLVRQFETEEERKRNFAICSSCGEQRHKIFFVLCQPRPGQNGPPRLVCNSCEHNLYINTDKIPVSDVLAKRSEAKTLLANIPDKVKSIQTLDPAAALRSLTEAMHKVNHFMHRVTDDLAKKSNALHNNANELQKQTTEHCNRRRTLSYDHTADYYGKVWQDYQHIHTTETQLNEQIKRQEEFRAFVDSTTSLITTLITKLGVHLREQTEGESKLIAEVVPEKGDQDEIQNNKSFAPSLMSQQPRPGFVCNNNGERSIPPLIPRLQRFGTLVASTQPNRKRKLTCYERRARQQLRKEGMQDPANANIGQSTANFKPSRKI